MADVGKEKSNISSISLDNISIHQDTGLKTTSENFTNIPLEGEEEKPKRLILKDPSDPNFVNKKGKAPRRIIHFSDGVLEEYSESEDEDETDKTPEVDPEVEIQSGRRGSLFPFRCEKTLTWLPWVWYYISRFGGRTLGVADMCGEKLAWMFGITSPKYQHAIDEYYRMKKEEEEEKAREGRELEAERQRRMKGASPVDVEEGQAVVLETPPPVGIYNKGFEMEVHSNLLKKKDPSDPIMQDNPEETELNNGEPVNNNDDKAVPLADQKF